MKNNFKAVSLLTIWLSLISQPTWADEHFLCTFGQKEREISLVYKTPGVPTPCEVRYKKEGTTEILWESKSTEGYCEEKAKKFVEKQIELGWRCNNLSQGDLIISQNIAPSTENYLLASKFAQAYATASILRNYIAEHIAVSGAPPHSLSQLGLKEEDMKTSSYFQDLALGESGALLIRGVTGFGSDSIIRVEPKVTLGGASLEWVCTTNIELNEVKFCAFDKNLKSGR